MTMTDDERATDLWDALHGRDRESGVRFVRIVLNEVRKEERASCVLIARAYATGATALALDSMLRPGRLEGEFALHKAARQAAENIAAMIQKQK
jgi:hypothetical protein